MKNLKKTPEQDVLDSVSIRVIEEQEEVDRFNGLIEEKHYLKNSKTAGRIVRHVAEYNGELSIIDYKTKRKPQVDEYMYEYYLQTTCYAQMFQEVTGKKIHQIVILVSSEKNTRQEFIKSCDDYFEPLHERIEKYYLNGLN